MCNESDNNNIILGIIEESINKKLKSIQIDTQQESSLCVPELIA